MEQWKDIPGYKGRYQASTAGRVRSLDRTVVINYTKGSRAGTSEIRRHKGRTLRPAPNPDGHLILGLGSGHKGKKVHKLVMLTFTGPAPPEHEVLHKNHDPSDNRLSNLKYGTRSENLKMDYANGSRRHLKVTV